MLKLCRTFLLINRTLTQEVWVGISREMTLVMYFFMAAHG